MTAIVKPQDFRMDDTGIQADPYAYYSAMREQAPVLETSFGGRPCYVVSRRADIDTVLMNPTLYSSRTTPIPNVLFSDPPDHTPLRQMVSGMLTRTAVARMEGQIVARAEALAEQIAGVGRCDIVADFAGPLTVSVISLLLGIEVPHVETLRKLTHLRAEAVLALRTGKVPSERSQRATEDLMAFWTGLISERAYSDDGVIAVLANLLAKGELTQEQFVAYAVLLFAAGHTTTTNLIANSVFILSQRPDYLDRLSADDSFITPFLEEVLRTRPSFHRLLRITTQDLELGGQRIPANTLVCMLIGSANRDAAFFDEAEDFDPDQSRRTHISFGKGIHSCLGNWLARLEASSALRVFACQFSSVSLEGEPKALTGGTFNEFGFEYLPVQLTSRQGKS